MTARLFALTLAALLTGVACEPSPPPADPESFTNSGTLCFAEGELTAVFDTCASSCDTVLQASCTLQDGEVETFYEIERGIADTCTADCNLHQASCGPADDQALLYGSDDLATADLPDCSELF